MDWKTLRRERLAKTASYGPNRRRDSWWWRIIEGASDWWERFHAFPFWEKLIVAGTAVLFVALTPLALVSLIGGDDGQTEASALLPTPTLYFIPTEPPPTDTPVPTPTALEPTPTATAEPSPTPLPDRTNCAAIAASSYRSSQERNWYLANCIEAEPATATPPPPPPPPPPNATQPPSTFYSAGEAAGLVAGWIASQPSLNELTILAGGCSARLVSAGQWRVSCQGETVGCVGATCIITITACLTDDQYADIWLC